MINTPKEKRSLSTEVSLALASSLFMGFGSIFMINLTGNYLWHLWTSILKENIVSKEIYPDLTKILENKTWLNILTINLTYFPVKLDN